MGAVRGGNYGCDELLTALRERGVAIPVAVGSGTVNDIVKRIAHRPGCPELAVATAASMDGYTAFGASITKDELKQTFDCLAPTAVLDPVLADDRRHRPSQIILERMAEHGVPVGRVVNAAAMEWR